MTRSNRKMCNERINAKTEDAVLCESFQGELLYDGAGEWGF